MEIRCLKNHFLTEDVLHIVYHLLDSFDDFGKLKWNIPIISKQYQSITVFHGHAFYND
jgi:hypothetical protein